MLYSSLALLPVETGFICDITEKTLQEYMHKRRGIVVRFIAAKRKTISRYAVSHPFQVAHLCLAAEEAWLLGPQTCSCACQAQEDQNRELQNFSVSDFPVCTSSLRPDDTQVTSCTAQMAVTIFHLLISLLRVISPKIMWSINFM